MKKLTHNILSSDEQTELALKAQNGCKASRNKLVSHNLRLVQKVAQKYKSRHSEDLAQEGVVGLCKAVDRFDPSKGTKFSTYATLWVRAYILRHLVENHRLVKIGTTANQKKLFFQLRKTQAALVAQGKEASHEAVAEILGVSVDEVSDMDLRMGGSEVSTDVPAHADNERCTLGDTLADDTDNETLVATHNLRDALRARFDVMTLKPQERDVVELRLLSDNPMTLQELADRWGKTRQRVQQVEAGLLGKLRKRFSDMKDIAA